MIILIIMKRTVDKNGNSINHVQLFENFVRFSNKELKKIKSTSILRVNNENITVYPNNLMYLRNDIEKKYGQNVRTLSII